MMQHLRCLPDKLAGTKLAEPTPMVSIAKGPMIFGYKFVTSRMYGVAAFSQATNWNWRMELLAEEKAIASSLEMRGLTLVLKRRPRMFSLPFPISM